MAIVHKDGRVEYEGRVLSTHVDHGYRIMSDVYGIGYMAVVVLGTGQTHTICTGDCEFGTYVDRVEVDATPETLALAAAWAADAAKVAAERQAKRAEQLAAAERKAVRKGRTVRVVRGRKVPTGTEGVCIWVGEGDWGERCGVKDAAGVVHWTASKNCEAI